MSTESTVSTEFAVCRIHEDGSIYTFSQRYPTRGQAEVVAAKFAFQQHGFNDYEMFLKTIKVVRVTTLTEVVDFDLSKLNDEQLKELLSTPNPE